jgi:hypothetical protein
MSLLLNYYSALVLRSSHLLTKSSILFYHKAKERAGLTGMKTRRTCSFKYFKTFRFNSLYTTRKYKEIL